MWKNPKNILSVLAPTIVHSLIEGNAKHLNYPTATEIFDFDDSSENTSVDELNFLSQNYVSIKEKISSSSSRAEAENRVGDHLRFMAQNLETRREWSFLTNLHHTATLMKISHHDLKAILDFNAYFIVSLHLLLGDETKMLVGTRGNMPAWLPWNFSMANSNPADFSPPLGYEMRYLDSNDVAFLPRQGEWLHIEEVQELPFPRIENAYIKIADLCEDAYYNQRYSPYPEGSRVKIQGIPQVEEVFLKTKRSLNDRNYIDFLAVFSIKGKKIFWPMSGSLANERYQDEEIHKFSDYLGNTTELLHWVMSQIYHDLVTAVDIAPKGRRSNQTLKSVKSTQQVNNSDPCISWIYIPRKVQSGEQVIRRESTTTRSMSPHRVRGHRRKANMSDTHRAALLQFEESTGLEVLRWIPEGYTFVRPHISPKDDSEALQQLPQFIRAKMQQELSKLLQKVD